MQTQNSVLLKFARNLLNLCQHQSPQLPSLQCKLLPPQWMQVTLFHTSTPARCSFQMLLWQREKQTSCNSAPKAPKVSNKAFRLCAQSHEFRPLPAVQLLRPYSKFTHATDPPAMLSSLPLTPERAHDLIVNLKDSERDSIKLALEKYEALKLKQNYEGKLAATQWRTKFGRPASLPTLGQVDPTGSFCAFPDDWLKKKAVENAKEPTKADLWKLFLVNAVPFIGFGFLDNFTMIIAGDYIENTLGYFMTLSTMAAAGLGNTISDVLGIGSAFYVERFCELMGLKPPDLTPIQMEMKSSRRAANYGRIIGITIGCLIGMFPLMFMDTHGTKKHPPAEKVATNV